MELQNIEQDDPRGLYIVTGSGAKFYLKECNVKDIPIEDIAHALAFHNRFNGHLDRFYSVAEHCVRVSYLVPQEHALWGLVHDMSEAFIPDIPSPFKSE